MSDLSSNSRPGLAIIANTLPPYRVHLHSELAAGIPELKIHTLVTHTATEFAWTIDAPPAIHASFFGESGDSPLTPLLRDPAAEWKKGGHLIQYLRDHDVRAVICNGYRYISYLRAIRYCRRAGIPLFYRNDSNVRREAHLRPMKQFFKSRFYSWLLRQTAGVMSMGECGDQFFLMYGADPHRLYRAPCWPDFDAFARVDANQLEGFRRKFHLSDTRRYILFSGRLAPEKRVDLLIDAFATVAPERPDWDLLIVGDGPLREELCRRVPDALRHRVVWIGFLQLSECVTAYHASEVLVLPSDRDAWGLVVQEAMASGLAVITSDAVGATHDLIDDQVSGRIFPVGDVAALKQAILDVTNEQAIADFKVRSRTALAVWRERNDPIAEIRRALTDQGVLPKHPAPSAAAVG